ncbi:MAG: glycosyltransferase [Methylococcus sp.]|nr:glycosyltransferase [Methylococcus sp.]
MNEHRKTSEMQTSLDKLVRPAFKLVFISDVATPQQIKFCNELQAYCDAKFLFYEAPERTRGSFWRIDLGSHCEVLDNVFFAKPGPLEYRYYAPGLIPRLEQFDPDVVMVGGFSRPSNFLAYRWARQNQKRTIVFTERSRDRAGNLRSNNLVWKLLRWLYRDVDMVVTSAEDIVPQFRDVFGFGDKVVAGRYAADLIAYFEHPLRRAKPAYTFLLANRMTEIYNPLGGLEIFAEIQRRYPASRLLMNSTGELGDTCRTKVRELGVTESVEFLTDIPSWAHLHEVYARSDVLLLPAHFSNGNFTILEAMASGMGIVISNQVLGTGKLIEDGVNGFSCAPNREAFVDRIERYINAPGLFERHASINRALVQPLSVEGTARFFAEIVCDRFGVLFAPAATFEGE